MGAFDLPHQLLAACALGLPETELREVFRRNVPRVAADRLLEAAFRSQMRPQIAPFSEMFEGTEAPAVRAQLESDAAVHRGNGLFVAAELARVLCMLEESGVRCVPFKGPAFAAFLGAGPGLREMADLDILLDERDLLRGVEVLSRAGYQPLLPRAAIESAWLPKVACELPFLHAGGTLIELHWRSAPHWYPASISAAEVLSRAVRREFFGLGILWPGSEELLLLHVTDGMKSGGSGIRWIGDLVAILRNADIDWDLVRSIAVRNGGLNAVRIALAATDDICRDACRALDVRVDARLGDGGYALAGEARAERRMAGAVETLKHHLGTDARMTAPARYFAWALRTSDHPGRIAACIARYLAGPAVADLAQLPTQGASVASVRAGALKRRFTTYIASR